MPERDDNTPNPGAGTLESPKVVRIETVLGLDGGNGLIGKAKDHEMRIRKLEIAQARIGVLAGLVSGAIVAAVTRLLGG